MSAAPEIHLGGPDPFPAERRGDCPHGAHHYLCTRNAGHDGPHVAMAHVVVAIWPPFEELPMEQLPMEPHRFLRDDDGTCRCGLDEGHPVHHLAAALGGDR